MAAGRAGDTVTAPLRNVGVEDARAAWHAAVHEAGGMQPLGSETIELALAVGRTTAEPVVARSSSPAFDAAAMDGIAVAAAATSGAPLALAEAAFRLVDTGDVLPAGTDAVVKREDVVLGAGATIDREIAPFANVRQVGEDVAVGELLLQPGHCLGPVDLAVVASGGLATVSVRRRPLVAIIPSGDELVPVGTELGPGEIFETNSLMLGAMVEQAGARAVCERIVPDDPAQLAEALTQAAASADLVLLLSGSAKGTADHTVGVIERLGQVIVQGVAVRPGHPVVLGVVGSTPVIGVPGYPVSAALAFELFAAPLLATLEGEDPPDRPRVRATTRAEIGSTPRSDEWVRVRIGRIDGRLVALPLRRGAAVLTSLARADGLVCVPSGSSGIEAGCEVEVELLRPLDVIEAALLVTGSTDPLLDHLAVDDGLSVDANGSANGAASLAAGTCHLALVASDDIPNGAIVLGAWERRLGLVVAAHNPLGINGIEALGRHEVRFVNRQQGSSSRALLDALLVERSVDPAAVVGYGREARSHAAAAVAVTAGAADCALGVSSACHGQPLEFVPLTTQTLALVAASNLETDGRVAGLRARLRSSQLRDQLDALGYLTLPS